MTRKPFVLSAKVVVRDAHGRCLLLKRSMSSKNNRGKWDLPGGKVDAGERFDEALLREVAEETGLSGLVFRQFRTYGDPERDPRGHTVSVVYVTEIVGEAPEVQGADDAANAAWFDLDRLPELAFDHRQILQDLFDVFGLR